MIERHERKRGYDIEKDDGHEKQEIRLKSCAECRERLNNNAW
jgi:hypothetical protein